MSLDATPTTDGLEEKSLKEICDLAKTNREFYIKNSKDIQFAIYISSSTVINRGIIGIVEYTADVYNDKIIIKDLEDGIVIQIDKNNFHISSEVRGYDYCNACIRYLYLKQLI